MSWNDYKIRNPEIREELDAVFGGDREVSVALTADTPVNAVASSLTITAEELALLDDDDTITFDGVVYTKGSGEDFTNATTLAAAIDATDDWGAAESSGDVVITAAVKGTAYDDVAGVISNVEDTTANGGAAADATATITEEAITELAAGDTVEFDGNTWTFTEGTPGDDEFDDQGALITLIDDLTDWEAADSSNDIAITSAANGAEWNDIDVVITYNRVTDGGVDGTLGNKGEIRFDSSKIYICTADNAISGANWKYASLT